MLCGLYLTTQLEQTLLNLPEVISHLTSSSFLFFFSPYLGLGLSCCAQTSTHCPLLQSPLPTCVIHFPRPLAERGVQQETGSRNTPTRCSIDLFVQCLPPLLLLLFLRLLLLPLLPPSYSPSQCECVLKCLPALCNIERPTAY